MDDISVFAQAKLEYTKQLVDVLYMNMYDGTVQSTMILRIVC